MPHEHIRFEDTRRFASLCAGDLEVKDPLWILKYAANVRRCRDCAEKARRANGLLLPEEYDDRLDPATFGEECLSVDELMEVEDDPKSVEHLRSCAGCQLRYFEVVAFSMIDGRESVFTPELSPGSSEAKMARAAQSTEADTDFLLRTAIRISKTWAAIRGGPELATGLLGPGDEEWLTEAVVYERCPLEHARLRIDPDSKLLHVSNLPESCPPDRLEVHFGEKVLQGAVVGPRDVQFDLVSVWQTGDHTLSLVVTQP